jgi:glutaconate CoA-transferase, subunit A
MPTHPSLDDLAAAIPDGALVAYPPDYSFVPMGLTRALIRRKARGLRLLAVPIGGMGVDMLIGAGCIAELEAAAVSLGEAGPAPQFTMAVRDGTIVMRDSTCPAIHSALQASEKGVPFMPLSGLIGSDILAHRPEWKVVDDPLKAGNGRIVLLPAIQPDVAIIHSPFADSQGNVWIGRRRELATMAHAAKRTVVTVEEIRPGDLLADEATAGGTLPSLYIEQIGVAADGAWPVGLPGYKTRDMAHVIAYARQAASKDGFQAYLSQHVLGDQRILDTVVT